MADRGGERDGDGAHLVPTPRCPPARSEAEEVAIRARRERAKERSEAKSERAERRRERAEDALDAAVAAELERLAARGDGPRKPADPFAPRVGADVRSCDGVRYLVVKVSKVQPSQDQVAVELFKRL